MKILINTPSLKFCGGVANHYLGLKNFWNANVKYNTVGKRHLNSPIETRLIAPFDIIKFIFRLITFRPNIVLVNPSMAPSALKRDFFYMKIAQFLGFKTSVMFHGFHVESVKDMIPLIVDRLNQTSVIFVLAETFKKTLVEWGVKTPIELTTTKVDDNLIKDFSIDKREGEVKNIIYLARVTKSKGIFISLDVFSELSKIYSDLRYTVVGTGPDLEEAKTYAADLKIPNITFTGLCTGDELIQQYKEADLYLFTSYHEGMPTSVLEAMAFGLPVVTRPVGGLVDFFNEQMGAMVDSYDAKDFIPAISRMIEEKEYTKQISDHNYQYAKNRFYASQVAKSMENTMEKYNHI